MINANSLMMERTREKVGVSEAVYMAWLEENQALPLRSIIENASFNQAQREAIFTQIICLGE